MKSLLYRSRYSLISHIALWSSLAPMWQVHGCYTQALPLLASILPSTSEQEEPRFTVNFNNTSVIEVIRFVSKITGTNFVFSEEDLSFNVTIVSEEPISAKNITSALIQVLRVNGCKLLEQEGNFLITKAATAVNQIPTLILDDKSASLTAPLVTQIFTIKNTDVTALVNLIRPMTSQTSQLEVFAPTRQLLVTDISTNVEKISALIQALDILYPNLEIESYTSKNASLEVLFSLTKQVMEPFAGTTPFLLVPQEGTNTLFLVSTPTLLDKALSILEDLDATPQVAAPNKTQEHHLYKVLGESPETFLASLQTAAEQMGKAGSPALAQAVQDAKVIPKTRTILFTTDKDTWKQLQDMLSTLDAVDPSSMEKENLYLYKVKQGDEQKIQATLEQAAKNLKDPALQKTLEQAQWLSDTRSFLFSGSESSLRTLKELLPTLDTPSGEQSHLEIFTYQVQHATKEQMSSALHQVLTTTKDPDLTQALKNVQWVSGTNLLLFQGTQEAIIELKTLLPSLDVPSSSATKDQVFVYSPKNIQGTVLLQKVEELSDTLIRSDLQDADFLAALQSANWTSASQTLIFTGTKEALHKIEPLVHSLDVIPESAQEASLLYTYEVHHATKEQMSDALHLLLSTTQDASLISTIKSMQWVSGTNLLLFQGPASAVAKLKTLLPSLDVPPSATVKDQTLVYAPKHLQGDILLQKLQELTSNFSSSGLQDVGLLAALHSAKWMSSSQTLAFTGSQASLARVRSLLETLDVDPSSSPIGGKKSSHELLTYRVEHATKEQMSRALDQLLSSTDNDDLAAAIKSMQWVAGTHLLLFHGTSSAIHELKTLLPSLDTPSIEAAKNQVLIYTPKFLSGDVLVQKLQEITENFQSSGLQDQELLATLNSARWAAGSHTITFTGNQTSLSRVETLLGTLDVATAVKQQSFLYKPSSTTESQLQAALASYAKNLDPADPSDQALLEAINRASWVAASQAFLFQSDPATLTRLKSLLLSLDNPSGHFYLYKLQQAQGDTVVEQLQTLAAHLPSSDSKTAELVQAIQNLKWIQDNNTLLLVGTPAVIDQLKSLVAEYDHAGERSSKALQSEFFLYKPLY
ncbi:MAG: hypothetical protein FJZ58_05185, partial [Chlamydiae bacterium]|nr:hypothetical protein [Chlamydiota bacterium]